jgi:Asp/Glu/hydantoin racemase
VRALWQSFLDPEAHRPYVEALRASLARAAPAAEFDVVGIRPPDRHLHALTEVRCGVAALRNALWAERAGYDAVVIGHFQEPLLRELRASVGLPVVGLGEASLAAARGRMGLVTIDAVFVPWHEEQVRRLGLAERVVGVRAVGVGPDGFMEAMADGPGRDRLRGRAEAVAAELVAAGAEVVVPAGGLLAVALPVETLAGVPFVDGVAEAARAALTARPPAAASPPPAGAVEEFLAATGGPLAEPVR